MRAYSAVDRRRPRNAGACPLVSDLKKWNGADNQHALLPERWGDVTSTIREPGE